MTNPPIPGNDAAGAPDGAHHHRDSAAPDGATDREADRGADRRAEAPAVDRPRRGLLVATVLAVALVDQVTKIIAVATLEGKPPVDVLGSWFQLLLLRNPGAAFSMGTGSTWLFTTIQIVFIVAVAIASRHLRTPMSAVAAGLIAGGALGNVIDRLFRDPGFYFGHVVDFLSVRGFAVFNIADAGITIGVLLLAAWIMFSPEPGEEDEGKDGKADRPSADGTGPRDA